MKYDDISPTMRAFIGGREAFRRLGFRADDLYCALAISAHFGALSCFVTLKTQGKEFNMEVGLVEDGDAFSAEYDRVAIAINAGELPEEVFARIWQESGPCMNAVPFILALKARNFRLPNVGN